jgi:serine/threonine protein kinase
MADSSAGSRMLLAGRYRLGRRLGKGGMGAVYEAQDTRLANHIVAIKENTNTAADAQEQFQREAVILSRLQHPSLTKVTDYFIEPTGKQYLVMDYVPGEDLEHIIRRDGALSEDEALRCMAQILGAIHYLHTRRDPVSGRQQPVVHRDIKPSNIKRTADGRYVLVDFGISKLGTTTAATVSSVRALTPGFAPIEQYDGGTDARSDIYSLGATLYAMLTLHIPPSATERSRRHSPLAPPRKYNSKLSPRTEKVIERAMAVEPADRYQAAAEMYNELFGRLLAGETEPAPVRRSRSWTAVGLAFGGLLAVIAAILIFNQAASPPAGDLRQPAAAAVTPLPSVDPTATTPPSPQSLAQLAEPETATSIAAVEPAAATVSPAVTASPAAVALTAAASPPAAVTSTAEETAGSALHVGAVAALSSTMSAVTPNPTTGAALATLSALFQDSTPVQPPAAGLAMAATSGATAPPALATRRPTSTPIPTNTRQPTPTPSATPLPTRTSPPAAPTATAAPVVAVESSNDRDDSQAIAANDGPNSVTILSPPNHTSTSSPTTFAWQPDSPLVPGQVYEVAFWMPNDSPAAGKAWTAATSSESVQINPAGRIGSYQWGVWLGMFDDGGAYKRLRYLGSDYEFVVSDPSKPSSHNNSDRPPEPAEPPSKGG